MELKHRIGKLETTLKPKGHPVTIIMVPASMLTSDMSRVELVPFGWEPGDPIDDTPNPSGDRLS